MERCPYFINSKFRVENPDTLETYTVGEIACMHPESTYRYGAIGYRQAVSCDGNSTNCGLLSIPQDG